MRSGFRKYFDDFEAIQAVKSFFRKFYVNSFIFHPFSKIHENLTWERKLFLWSYNNIEIALFLASFQFIITRVSSPCAYRTVRRFYFPYFIPISVFLPHTYKFNHFLLSLKVFFFFGSIRVR